MELIYTVESKTTEHLQDEPWYSDYQSVCEIMCAGPNSSEDFIDKKYPSFYERLPDGLDQALKVCKQYFNDFPGPPGWTPPDDARIIRWIKTCWLNEETIQKLEAVFDHEINGQLP